MQVPEKTITKVLTCTCGPTLTNKRGYPGHHTYCLPASASPRNLNNAASRSAAKTVADEAVQSRQTAAHGRQPCTRLHLSDKLIARKGRACKGISDVGDVVRELREGDAACGQLPGELGGRGEDEVGSCVDVERGEICEEGWGERWCEVG